MHFLAIVLLPFTLLYDLITRFRNYLYNIQYKKSFSFETNVIAVGNLSVGGTGKSPMVEYLINLLHDKYNIVTLSRGYGRKTRGFRIVTNEETPRTVGDEPFQFFQKFDDIHVTVGEERAVAIPFILAELEDTNIILLDDAYQHRSVKPSLNILLTDFNKPFYNDYILPSGRLRESRSGAKRADIIVVTKCDPQLSEETMDNVINDIKKYNNHCHIAFTQIKYFDPVPIFKEQPFSNNVLLFSGIANAKPLTQYVRNTFSLVEVVEFPDHHNYKESDLESLKSKIEKEHELSLLTTEKDMIKIKNDPMLAKVTRDLPIFYLPIKVEFLKDGKTFDDLVFKSIVDYSN